MRATCFPGPVNHGSNFFKAKIVPESNRDDHAGEQKFGGLNLYQLQAC